MWFKKSLLAVNRAFSKVSVVLHSVGMGVVVVMMLLTAADVTLRKLFNSPILGSFELTEYMMAIVIAFGLAYAYVRKEHVAVDLVVSRFSQKAQNIFDIVVAIIGFALFSVIAWQSTLQAIILFNSRLTSAVLKIPVYPFQGLVALGCAILAIAILGGFFESLTKIISEKEVQDTSFRGSGARPERRRRGVPQTQESPKTGGLGG